MSILTADSCLVSLCCNGHDIDKEGELNQATSVSVSWWNRSDNHACQLWQ